jgi:hypothetical protein
MTTNIRLAVGGNWFGVAWYWYVLALIALVLQSGFVLKSRRDGITHRSKSFHQTATRAAGARTQRGVH